ncbi:MAG TPA: hypothetical protein VMI34_09925 [Candidatus Bathyarchaeia archaeon]|nr:hypothetical protein [Candidatus Bathyarchaeia archaeon]
MPRSTRIARGVGADARRVSRTSGGQQDREARALVRSQLIPRGFHRAKERDFEVRPDLRRLADLRLPTRHVHRPVRRSIQQRPEVYLREHEVCLPPDRRTQHLETEAAEALHLRGGEPQLALAIENQGYDGQRDTGRLADCRP